MAKSSCINCSAVVARVNATAISRFDFIVGVPDQTMFYFSDGSRKSLQLDFVWGFLLANPIPKPARSLDGPPLCLSGPCFSTALNTQRSFPTCEVSHGQTR